MGFFSSASLPGFQITLLNWIWFGIVVEKLLYTDQIWVRLLQQSNRFLISLEAIQDHEPYRINAGEAY